MKQTATTLTTDPTNEQLMQCMQWWYEGQDQAFDVLVSRVRDILVRRAYRRLPDWTSARREKAEDLVQDALVKALCTRGKSASRWQPERGSVLTWLGAILNNEIANQRRRKQGNEILMSDLGADTESEMAPFESRIPDGCPSVDDELHAREHAQHIQERRAVLGEQERAILAMRVEEGKTYEEIGQALGCSKATAFRRLRDIHASLERS